MKHRLANLAKFLQALIRDKKSPAVSKRTQRPTGNNIPFYRHAADQIHALQSRKTQAIFNAQAARDTRKKKIM